MKVLISYSWHDEALRKAVADHLAKIPNVEVLFDQLRITEGQSVHPSISQMIDAADVVIAVVTPSSLQSREVADELARANERSKLILPLVSSAVEPSKLPFYLQDVLRIDFAPGELDKKIEQLKSVIRERMKARASRVFSKLDDSSSVRRPVLLQLDSLQRSNLGQEMLEQVLVYCQIFNFAAPSRSGDGPAIPLFVCPNVFIPDDWTVGLIRGVAQVAGNNSRPLRLLEVGVGTGAVPITLSRNFDFRFASLVALDIDTLAAEVARINFRFHGLAASEIISGLQLDEAREKELIEAADRFDIIAANIPQVPTTSARQVRDHFDYYGLPLQQEGEWDLWARNGLWLVARTLVTAKSLLAADGVIVLVISARPTRGHITTMAEVLGYEFDLLFSTRVRQDPGMDISSLVACERTSASSFEFFLSPKSDSRISAADAQRSMLEGRAVYQDLLVIAARPMQSKATAGDVSRAVGNPAAHDVTGLPHQ